MSEEKNLPECDRIAIWKTIAKSSGISYFSGVVEFEGKKIRIVAFPNKDKVEENQPDYIFKRKKESAVGNYSVKPLWYEERD